MKIGGLQKTSLIDYPDIISAVVFTQGCNLKCGYCHNGVLLAPLGNEISEETFFDFLDSRKKYLQGIVVTGGEPTIHSDLPEFLSKIRLLGFKIKLDTNGSNPEMVAKLIKEKLVDFIALDIKQDLDNEKYEFITGKTNLPHLLENIKATISIILNSKIKHEFRLTAIKGVHRIEDIRSLINKVKGNFILQTFNPDNVYDPNFSDYKSFSKLELEDEFPEVVVR
jgi:pyruvate formate lyase activating enzyme